MSQVSRPFQIALVAMVLLVMVWFVALRGHGTSSSSEPTSAASPTTPSKAAPSTIYTGAAPGVAGLSKAIAKAHGAVRASEKNAKDLQSKSAKLSGEAASSTSVAPAPAASAAHGSSTPQDSAAAAAKPGSAAASKSSSTAQSKAAADAATNSAAKARQLAIKHELAHGKVVLLMFWNPKSSDDRSVRGQLHAVGRRDGRVAVHVALQSEVGAYGGYTQGVQILQTPTVLVIGGNGQATMLTGLNDARTIQQAIGDALRGGAGKVQAPKLTAWVHGSPRSAYIGKVNGLCKRPFSQGGDQFEGAARKQITSFKAFTATLVTFMARLRKIAPPAQDRQHIFTLIGDFDAGTSDLDRALAAATAGHALAARQLVLEAQVQFDQSTTGLGEYGFTACFPEYAN